MGQDFSAATDLTMASPWRRRRMCVLHAGKPVPAALEAVSGRGARISSNAHPERGTRVMLSHPTAGEIKAWVKSVDDDGLELAFDPGEEAIAFALCAITADMTTAR
jgi:hypothetical protein